MFPLYIASGIPYDEDALDKEALASLTGAAFPERSKAAGIRCAAPIRSKTSTLIWEDR
jgi:hypothetical protein